MLCDTLFAGTALMTEWVRPEFLWQMKKDELPGIDAHGRAAVNSRTMIVGVGMVDLMAVPFFNACG